MFWSEKFHCCALQTGHCVLQHSFMRTVWDCNYHRYSCNIPSFLTQSSICAHHFCTWCAYGALMKKETVFRKCMWTLSKACKQYNIAFNSRGNRTSNWNVNTAVQAVTWLVILFLQQQSRDFGFTCNQCLILPGKCKVWFQIDQMACHQADFYAVSPSQILAYIQACSNLWHIHLQKQTTHLTLVLHIPNSPPQL